MREPHSSPPRSGSAAWIRALRQAATIVEACADEIEDAHLNISRVCEAPAPRAWGRPDLTRESSDRLARLCAFYFSISRQFRVMADRLQGGTPPRRVRQDLIAYAEFLKDQIEAEERGAARVLDQLGAAVLSDDVL